MASWFPRLGAPSSPSVQPAGSYQLEIDPTHRLAPLVVGAFMPSEPGGWNVTRNLMGRPPLVGVISSSQPDIDGSYFSGNGTTGAPLLAGLAAYTVFVVFKNDSVTSGANAIIGERVGGGNPVAFSTIGTSTNIRVLLRDTAGNAVDFTGTGTPLVNTKQYLQTFAVTADLTTSGAPVRLYQNGVLNTSGARPATWTGTAGASVFGTLLSGLGPSQTNYYALYAFAGALPAADIVDLTANPYALVRPIFRRSHIGPPYVPPPSSGWTPQPIWIF